VLQLLHARLELVLGEVPIAPVDRLELAPIDGHQRFAEQVQVPAQHHKLPTHAPDRLAVVLPKVRNRLEVRCQPSREPDQLDVALALALQSPARLDPVQIPVDVDLQQRSGVVGRSTRRLRLCALKTQFPQIQLVHKHIDHPHRVVLGDVLIQALRE
jgi:hypothetical protein